MEAVSCLPCCRSLRLVQTFGAAENSLSISSMQALSAVLHVSALRPNSRHPNPFADHPKADIALLKLE